LILTSSITQTGLPIRGNQDQFYIPWYTLLVPPTDWKMFFIYIPDLQHDDMRLQGHQGTTRCPRTHWKGRFGRSYGRWWTFRTTWPHRRERRCRRVRRARREGTSRKI